MYYDYFGLKQPPFKITPDTNLFFPGGERGAILEALVYAVTSGEGIIKVVGEVGSGKTMLCRMLQKELPDNVEIVYLANPSLSPENTLQAIAFELQLPIDAGSSKLEVMHQLQQYLLEKHSNNQQVVVFIEEAQGMPLATLEEIRLLSNLETNQNKLLQIILFGQPELDEMMSRKEIRQLKERITYSFHLNPFKTNDIRDYLNTRLRSCGYRAGEIFNDGAVKIIGKYSNGLVRRINILADKSMLAAYATNTNTVTAKHVRQAARDSEFVSGFWQKWVPAICLFLAVFIGSAVFWQYQSGRPGVAAGPVAEPLDARVDSELGGGPEPTEPSMVVSPTADLEVSSVAAPAPVATPQLTPAPAQDVEETRVKSDSKSVSLQLSESIAGASGEAEVPEQRAIEMAPADAGQARRADPEVANLEQPQSSDERDGPFENQLIGLTDVFRLQDMGDSRLTDQELTILQRQLESLPPEAAFLPDSLSRDKECKLCWSIIYRPVVDTGNL